MEPETKVDENRPDGRTSMWVMAGIFLFGMWFLYFLFSARNYDDESSWRQEEKVMSDGRYAPSSK